MVVKYAKNKINNIRLTTSPNHMGKGSTFALCANNKQVSLLASCECNTLLVRDVWLKSKGTKCLERKLLRLYRTQQAVGYRAPCNVPVEVHGGVEV